MDDVMRVWRVGIWENRRVIRYELDAPTLESALMVIRRELLFYNRGKPYPSRASLSWVMQWEEAR